jgi:hypothetical protein
MGGDVALIRKRRNACKILVGKPEVKRPLGRPRHRWENNIKTNLREIGWGKYGVNLSGSG